MLKQDVELSERTFTFRGDGAVLIFIMKNPKHFDARRDLTKVWNNCVEKGTNINYLIWQNKYITVLLDRQLKQAQSKTN